MAPATETSRPTLHTFAPSSVQDVQVTFAFHARTCQHGPLYRPSIPPALSADNKL